MWEWCNKFNYSTQRGYWLFVPHHISWHLPKIGRLNQLVVFQSASGRRRRWLDVPPASRLPIQPSVQLDLDVRPWFGQDFVEWFSKMLSSLCFYGPLLHASSSFRFSFWRQLYTRILWPSRLLLAAAAAWVSSPAGNLHRLYYVVLYTGILPQIPAS